MEDEKEKNKVGRPLIVLTDEQIVQVEALAAYLPIDMIADYLGIHQTTFNELKKRDERISHAYARGRAKAIGSMAQSLVKKGLGGDTPAMVFYLRTQGKWKEETDPTTIINIPKSFNDFYSDSET